MEKQNPAPPARVLSREEVINKLGATPAPARQGYLAMYSTWLGGVVREPGFMVVPVDDHIVHRGDGVFEAVKCVAGKVYALDRHLDRLSLSAGRIALKLPMAQEELKKIAIETTQLTGAKEAMLRIYVSRGPGGFTANPYESIGSQLYLVVTPFKPMAAASYEKGVSVKISAIGIKEGIFSQVKSCNYLPNVLMKKESVDSGVDFTVTRDEKGGIAESSTENFALISNDDEFLVPGFERTLKGVTAVRAMELADQLVKKGLIKAVRNHPIQMEDVRSAKEAMMLGTTLDCLPVTTFEGKAVNEGQVGPVCKELLALLRADMEEGPLALGI